MTSKSLKIKPPAQIYLQMRQRVMDTDPLSVGILPNDSSSLVWGIMMEFVTGSTPVTLVSLADGTTSLYFGNGGGVIGGGGDAGVAQASRDLVALAESYLDDLQPIKEIPLISGEIIRFIALTYNGSLCIDVPQVRLFNGNHLFMPLFNQANRVISLLRMLQENKVN